MAGRPIRRGRAVARSRSRKAFDDARARTLALSVTLNQHRPGAGDELLDRATAGLESVIGQVLSGFPLPEGQRNFSPVQRT